MCCVSQYKISITFLKKHGAKKIVTGISEYFEKISLCFCRFCSRHGRKDTHVIRTPPPALLDMAKFVIPRLCLRLQQQLKDLEPYATGMFVFLRYFVLWAIN